MKRKRKRHPILYLLLIPIILVVDLLILWLGTYGDTLLFSGSEALGHPLPVFTLLAMLVALVVTIVVIILSIVLTVHGFKVKRQEEQE